MPYRTFAVLPTLILAGCLAAACSSDSRQKTPMTMVNPSPVDSTAAGGGISHGALVSFPPRADGADFRSQLENKYVSMGRTPAQVYVDQNGEATWVGEYDRYRVNGCDHNTATQYALAEVDGAAAAPVCSVLVFPETAIYPSRDQLTDFRRQLGAKYQTMGRTAQSAVDPDGAAIWLGEYYRYRTSGCDQATATQNVMAQIDGQPAPPSCSQACAYNLDTPTNIPGNGGTFTVTLIRTSGTCDWIAGSQSDWITVNRPITGGDRSVLSYNVQANTGGARSGTIKFVYPGGASYLTVNQGSPSYTLSFQLFDPAVSQSTPTNECKIRTTNTVCTLAANTATLPSDVATYDWKAEYTDNGNKVKTQVGPLSTFSFAEACSTTPVGADGTVIPLVVTLTAADSKGNSGTVASGQGTQAYLQLRVYTCP